MLDMDAIAEATAELIQEYVDKATRPLLARLEALEGAGRHKTEASSADALLILNLVDKAVAAIPRPKDGEDGRSIERADVQDMVDIAVAAIPTPKDGRDAEPYAPDPEQIRALLVDIVAAEIAKLPVAKDGTSVAADDVRPLIETEVSKAVGALPDPAPYEPDSETVRSLLGPIVEGYLRELPAPKDGTSVTIDDVRPIIDDEVARAVGALPDPTPYEPDPATLRSLLGPIVELYVREIPAAKDGTSVTVDDVRPLISEEVVRAVGQIPVPKDADPYQPSEDVVRGILTPVVEQLLPGLIVQPKDGASVTLDDVRPLIDEAISRAVGEIPVPKDAEPYQPSEDVVRGILTPVVEQLLPGLIVQPKDGASVTIEDVRPLINDEIARAVEQLPVPRDGVGMAGALIDRAGALVVTLTDGSTRELGPVVGKDADMDALVRAVGEAAAALPVPKDGADGFGFDDMALEHDGERGFVLRFVKGDRTKDFRFKLPVMIDRGVYKEGAAYDRGDAVTWGGSIWVAQRDTTEKPERNEDWRLAVKRGRDARAPADSTTAGRA
ncbi:MAG: Phage portal protein [Sphingomonas bacterium]|nr:Phage portal protein [Sphingomonas bacterium]